MLAALLSLGASDVLILGGTGTGGGSGVVGTGPLAGTPLGPLEDLESLYVCTSEDFSDRLTDLQTSAGAFTEPNDFTSVGWVVTENGTLAANALLRSNHSSAAAGDLLLAETSSLLVVYPGSTADTGINLYHVRPGATGIPNLSGGSGAPTQATGSVTFTSTPPIAGETITIGGIVYTFVAAASNPYEITIGGSANGHRDNLIAALNHTGTPGTGYGAATAAHPAVSGSAGAAGVANLTARVPDTFGNAITLTEALTGTTVSGSTLSGGRGARSGGSVRFIDVNPGIFGDREVFWSWQGALFIETAPTTWDSKFAVGLSLPDTDLMTDSTGALSWVNDGGLLFHIAEDGTLTFNVRRGTTTTVPTGASEDLSTYLDVADDSVAHLGLGFRWTLDSTIGEGTVQAYKRHTADGPWAAFGSPLTGANFPTTNSGYRFHMEANNGPTSLITVYTEWVRGCMTRELRVGE